MVVKYIDSTRARHESIAAAIVLACFLVTWFTNFGVPAAHAAEPQNVPAPEAPPGFRPLFDGQSLWGWHPAAHRRTTETDSGEQLRPIAQAAAHRPHLQGAAKLESPLGRARGNDCWSAGRLPNQEARDGRGLGFWQLVDDGRDFRRLRIVGQPRPDWPCDTGIYVRSTPLGQGFQVLLDHRGDDTSGVGGSIGFLYLRGVGGFLVNPYNFRWTVGDDGVPHDLQLAPANPPKTLPEFAATSDDFRRAWRMNDWNTLRIRVVGDLPRITTWINDVKICECDTAAIEHADYDAAGVKELLGPRGHIAFEVHDGPPWRWGVGKVARWKNIYIKEL